MDCVKDPVEYVIDVLQLLVEIEGSLDVLARQHLGDIWIGQQQRLELALLGERPHGVSLHPLVRLFTADVFSGQFQQHGP